MNLSEIPELTIRAYWSKVAPGEDGHWGWNGARAEFGHPRVYRHDIKRYMPASTLAYLVGRGPVPDDHDVVAPCGGKWCLNPAHLEVVERGERTCACGKPIRRHHSLDPWPETCYACRRGTEKRKAAGSAFCLGPSPEDCEVGYWHDHCRCGDPKSLGWHQCVLCDSLQISPRRGVLVW